jgi:hypothetical protein
VGDDSYTEARKESENSHTRSATEKTSNDATCHDPVADRRQHVRDTVLMTGKESKPIPLV